MLKRKLLVTVITCLLSFIVFTIFQGWYIGTFRETGLENITKGFPDWVTLYLIFFVPVIFVYGLPVSILSDFISKKISTNKRMLIAYFIHIGLAALPAIFLFESIFSVATILIAAIFFVTDEVFRSIQEENKISRKSLLFAMILPVGITGAFVIPNVNEEIQTDKEMERLDEEGFPEPYVVVDGQEYTDIKPMACWDNDDTERCGEDVYPLTSTNLEGSKADLVVEPGSTLHFKFDNSPSEPIIQISYWKNDERQKTTIENNVWVVPNEPGMYGYGINADWKDMSLGFPLNIEVK